jgi:hypothetical protein
VSYLPHRLLLTLSPIVACCALACEDPLPAPDGSGGSELGGAPASGGSTGTGGTGTPGTGGATTGPSACGSGDMPFLVLAEEANNMTFSSTITLTEQKVPPSNTDLTFDWSDLTQDFLGHDLEFQGGLKAMALVVWKIPFEEVADHINANDPMEEYVLASIQFAVDGSVTTAPLSAFTSFDAEVTEEERLDYLDPANNYSYTLMAQAHPTKIGQDVQMIQAFTLDEDAESTTVNITDESTQLEWEANLDLLTPTKVPADQGDITVDWYSTIATTSYGAPFINNQITEVLVGRFPEDHDLNTEFLDIELDATELWRGKVTAGSKLNLLANSKGMPTLTNADGEQFTGVPEDTADQWVLGLICTTCVNPTPWYITRLETCP